jgi:hypothetical protein
MFTKLFIFRFLLFAILMVLLFSCARSVTPERAAGGGFKKCRGVL